jgi:hypothetical protein
MEAVQYADRQFGPINGMQYSAVHPTTAEPQQFRISDQSRTDWQQSGKAFTMPRPQPTSLNPQQQQRRN